MKENSWANLYGARRKAIDKALLAKCERQIAAEEKTSVILNPSPPIALNDEELNRISRAFGRPIPGVPPQQP